MTVRPPAVAGTFYPAQAAALRREVVAAMPSFPRERAVAVVVPHAGYAYSGRVAGETFARVEIPRDVVLLCFHHRGHGAPVAVWDRGAWSTPLGEVPVQEALAAEILRSVPGAQADPRGHLQEHSGEVQLPFLQVARPDVRVVPVALSTGLDEASVPLLRGVGTALAGLAGDFLVVVSTDLNHYEDQLTTLEKDRRVIDALERLDEAALRAAVDGGVSMCGAAPAVAGIAYAKARGARGGRVVRHATSAEAAGDTEQVVGYVGMIIT